MSRLGLAVPLGGTTLFFRRAVLEELGGWDAHNVTEDADLGIRLARHGYRTELLDTVTGEEANCRVIPWIKQRSRWIKGYMMTYAVHMRGPRLLLRQLGLRQFLGFQVMFLGTILQFLLAPLMWSFWSIPLGLGHPLSGVLSHRPNASIMAMIFILSEVVNVDPRHRGPETQRPPAIAALGGHAAVLFPAGGAGRLQRAVGNADQTVLLGQDPSRHLRPARAANRTRPIAA